MIWFQARKYFFPFDQTKCSLMGFAVGLKESITEPSQNVTVKEESRANWQSNFACGQPNVIICPDHLSKHWMSVSYLQWNWRISSNGRKHLKSMGKIFTIKRFKSPTFWLNVVLLDEECNNGSNNTFSCHYSIYFYQETLKFGFLQKQLGKSFHEHLRE